MSKERRKKQFDRLVTTLYARQSVDGEAIGDQLVSERQLKKLIQRMAADNTPVEVAVDDDPANVSGFTTLERCLGKYGVFVEEVPVNSDEAPVDDSKHSAD